MIKQFEIRLPAFRRGFHLITSHIVSQLNDLPDQGLVNIFLHHTSAGLIINENADPSVPRDMNSSFDKLVPERLPHYTHVMEGDDDMPAHIKSALTGASLTIPVAGGRLKLGTWQGIFLCEFRNHGGGRRITVTVYS
jgi:secondary thiamine-phosphate synthase enzyme